jgi:hypothetical protein
MATWSSRFLWFCPFVILRVIVKYINLVLYWTTISVHGCFLENQQSSLTSGLAKMKIMFGFLGVDAMGFVY